MNNKTINLNENQPSSKKIFQTAQKSNNKKYKNNIHTNYTPKSKKSFKNIKFDIDLDNQPAIKKKNTHTQKKNDIDQKNNDSQIKNNIDEKKKKNDTLILNNNTKPINKDLSQKKISHNKNKFLKDNSIKSITNKNINKNENENEKKLNMKRKSLNQFSKNITSITKNKSKKSLNNKKLIHNDNFFSNKSEQSNYKPNLNQQLISRYFDNKQKKNNKKIPLKSLKDNFNVKVKTINTFDRFNIDTDNINIKEARIYLFNNGIIKNQNIPDNIIINMYIMFTNN